MRKTAKTLEWSTRTPGYILVTVGTVDSHVDLGIGLLDYLGVSVSFSV